MPIVKIILGQTYIGDIFLGLFGTLNNLKDYTSFFFERRLYQLIKLNRRISNSSKKKKEVYQIIIDKTRVLKNKV